MPGKWILCFAVATVIPLAGVLSADALVAYPDGYRTWTHVKSMVIQPGHALADPFEGIHHTYANDSALDGLGKGRYDDGAVFVFDLLDYEDASGALVEADRKFIGVMEFDEARFAETGGWGFEVFAGDSRTERAVSDGGVSCFACHLSASSSGHVFTRYRE